MAHFYGTVQGNRGQGSRCGSQSSGLSVSANGWRTGADVEMTHDNGFDVVRVWKTTGSAMARNRELIAEWKVEV